ncbi:hypothetical protein T08_8793 [Trichinella sp. T8]|nr:hypothetical protein T08_8793 [Trichinella sp. T8]
MINDLYNLLSEIMNGTFICKKICKLCTTIYLLRMEMNHFLFNATNKGRSCLLVENCMTSCWHSACVPAQRLCRMRTIVKEMFMTQQDVQHQDGEDDCYCLQHATRHLNSAELSTHSQMCKIKVEFQLCNVGQRFT